MSSAKKNPFSTTYEAVPELDTPRYLFGDVAAAAQISPGTLKAWLTREPRVVALGAYDQLGRGKGTARLLTLRRVYAIAITAELVSLGFVASRAGVLAFMFTDLRIPASKEWRDTFVASKKLFLLANPTEDIFSITDAKSSLGGVMEDPGPPHEEPLVSCAVINCGALMARVRARLKERGVA